MKKIFLVLLAASLFVMCKSSKSSAAKAESPKEVAEVRYRDDFRSAKASEKKAVLSELKASEATYSVLIFTQNFKGEKVTASNARKQLYSGYVISDPKTGIADKIRIDNSVDTKVYDDASKRELIIEAREAKKAKFIYLMKNPGGDTPFIVTYSNTLRPLK